jgi:hypothetical protein
MVSVAQMTARAKFFCSGIMRVAENSVCRLLKKISEARRAKFDELRRTLQYVEASRASATKPMSLFQQPAHLRLFSGMALLAIFGAPQADLWPKWQKHDPASAQKIDHSAWDKWLQKYLVAPHPSGVNRVRYGSVAPEDRKALKDYLENLQSLPISAHNRAEQKAYWINLYNALTVDVVLSHYPVRSIRDIGISPGLFSRGPWDAKLLTVEGEKLSLNDIEHRILRPIWKDARVHYAVNCASLGCPNLQLAAYTGGNAESLLEKGAGEYINHPRGVAIKNGKLQVSSIYEWFKDDFGASRDRLLEHWLKSADKDLADALRTYKGSVEYSYDWSLNGAETKP